MAKPSALTDVPSVAAWNKHLRKYAKRAFHKAERKNVRADTKKQVTYTGKPVLREG